MKSKLTIIIICLLPLFAKAQQEALYAQFFTNAYLINPATAGSEEGHRIYAFHRWQWVSFPGSPVTFGVTYQGRIGKVHGLGACAFRDETGPTKRTGAKVSYAFQIPLTHKGDEITSSLGIGVAGKFQRHFIHTEFIKFIVENDNAVNGASQGKNTGDVEFGVNYKSRRFQAGVSALNLVRTQFDIGSSDLNRSPLAHQYLHLFAYGKYLHSFEKFKLEPVMMVKYVNGVMPQVDAGMRVHLLRDQIAFGVAWRNPSFLSFSFGVLLDKSLPLNISFDLSTARFQNYSMGSSEINMGVLLPYENRFNVRDMDYNNLPRL